MLKQWNDRLSWPTMFADSEPADSDMATVAEARLSEQISARPWQRRSARAAIEFNARLPERTRQEGIMPVRPPASDSLPDAGDR